MHKKHICKSSGVIFERPKFHLAQNDTVCTKKRWWSLVPVSYFFLFWAYTPVPEYKKQFFTKREKHWPCRD